MSHDNLVIIPVETTEQDDIIYGKDDTPHNSRPIIKMELSPKSQYIVTYSKEDHSIIGWNVKDTDEGQLTLDISIKISDKIKNLDQICVSDDKKLVYVYNNRKSLKIIDMNYHQEIELYFCKHLSSYYCAFNLRDEFILYSDINHSTGDNKILWVYSTQTKNNKWICKRIYMISDIISEDVELISISKDDKLYLISNDHIIYELNILTEKSTRLFVNKNKFEAKDIKILSDKKFTCLKINDSIIIYSVELKSPIASLDINNGNQLHNFMKHPGLYPLLLSLFDDMPSNGSWKSIMDYCWKECFKQLKENNKLPNNYNRERSPTLPIVFDNTTKYAFGILDGYIWKTKFEKKFDIKSSFFNNTDELHNENDNTYEHLNILSRIDIHVLIKEAKGYKSEYELIQNLIKWKIKIKNKEIELQVLKKDEWDRWELITTRIEKFNIKERGFFFLRGTKLYNNNDIVILTTIGPLIYHFNEDNNSLSLIYLYFTNLYFPTKQDIKKYQQDIENNKQNKKKYMKFLWRCYKKIFSKPTLPISNYDSFKSNDEWVLFVKNDKSSLLKNGVELLTFAIKEHKLELLEDIYKKCLIHFKQDLRNNGMFLSIITSTTQILNEYYPEYILRYSSETTMIIDSSSYNIEVQSNDLHLYSFTQDLQIVNLTQSTLWTKYQYLTFVIAEKRKGSMIIATIPFAIQLLILLLMSPIFLPIFYIFSKYHLINDIYRNDIFSGIYFKLTSKFSKFSKHMSIPTITFIIPYIKFVNYPKDYNWFWELIRPHSSPFVETINRDIYKTWDGEAIINFKWNTYGKYYYAIIWIGFMALLGCFTVAAIPKHNFDDKVQKQLFIASIILGFIHLIFEIRQLIYNPTKWINNIWNLFDMIAYLFPIYTSFYCLKTNNENVWLLAFSCLFLDLKFLLFFRAFESFGVYFAIIISVGKQIISFLVVLLIIIISFAHAFYILLSPRSDYSFEEPNFNDDSNNPWNVTPTYKGFNGSNQSLIQVPDENTNMFIDYGTALFAMYLFLTGDSSSLSHWPYKKNPPLVILMVLFSFSIVVYLMNLFIGLLNMAIEKDKDRVSYLTQKAEILAEIELFYLLPYQRRWKTWFPEVIYYYANVDKTREKIKTMISKGEWNTNEFPELKKELLNKLNIQHE